jgi:enoyl-CoA hydratase
VPLSSKGSDVTTAPGGHSPLLVDHVDHGIKLVTLNRPQRNNALNMPLIEALHAVFDESNADPACRALILTGAGNAFCVGADFDLIESVGPDKMSTETLAEDIAHTADLVVRMRELKQPVIAAINGVAAGGGFALALGADIRFCTESARFTTAFTKIGLAGAEMGISYLLPRIISPTVAWDLMLTSRVIGADEAIRAGLVRHSVPAADLLPTALDTARLVASMSPFAITQTKKLMWDGLAAQDLRSAVHTECQTQMLCIETSAHADAVQQIRSSRPTTNEVKQ